MIEKTAAADAWEAECRRWMLRATRFEGALELIAAPRRPDGTYNRSREACEELARKVLEIGRAEYESSQTTALLPDE